MKKISRKTLAGIVLALSVLFIVFVFYFYQVFFEKNILVDTGHEKASVEIPYGADLNQVMDTLNKGNIVNDAMTFRFVAKIMDYHKQIKPGHYVLEKGWDNLKAVRHLRAGKQEPVEVTFNNVRTRAELAEEIARELALSKDSLLARLNDPEIARKYGFDSLSFPCMFLPNTYEMYWTASADEFLDRMHEEYNKFWTKHRQSLADSLELTRDEVCVLASIVQAETNKNAEKDTIAGVYINRLQKDMKLEADPTAKFAAGDPTIKRVLDKHTRIDSPYNTYKYKGLPPGPINIPSIASLDAVLNHVRHDYIYFCAKADFSGYHTFAEHYWQHKQNARAYRRELTKRLRRQKENDTTQNTD